MIPKDLHIPGYDIEAMLGKGGMAAVYRARQQSFGREVALKILNPVVEDLEDFSSRFLRESLIVAKLHHSHIVQVYDLGQHENYFYICMEYLEGGDLAHKLRTGITLKESVRIIKQLADALDFAHRKNIIHRDIKPENILFREDGAAVLTDFGIAKELESQTEATLTGLIMGTPKYMSPEYIRGETADHRSDIYALGIVFYRCLTNYVPFDGKDMVTTAYLQTVEPVPPLPPEVACFQEIINRLLEKAPEDRFQNGRDIVAALENLDPSAYLPDLTNLAVAAANKSAPPTVTRTASGRHSVKAPRPHGNEEAGAPSSATQVRAYNSIANGDVTVLEDHMLTSDCVWDLFLEEAEAPPAPPKPRRSKTVAAFSGVLLMGALAFPANQSSDDLGGGPWLESIADMRERLMEPWGATSLDAVAALVSPEAEAEEDAADPGVETEAEISTERDIINAVPAEPPVDGMTLVEMTAPSEPDSSAVIAALLEEAELSMAKKHFRQPADDNAYLKYQKILALEPSHAAALAGIQRIAGAYLDMAEQAIAEQQFDRARGFLTEVKAVEPDHVKLPELQKKLAVAIARHKEVTRRKEHAAAAQKSARIEELLVAAKVDEQAGRIRTPFGNNALEKYQQILDLDPDQVVAVHKLIEYGR